MLIGLLVFILLLILFLLVEHKNDYMAPGLILSIVYAVAIIFSIYNWKAWQLDSYSFLAAQIIGVSVFEFAVVGIIIDRYWRRRNVTIDDKETMIEIKTPLWFCLLNLSLCIIALFLTIRSNPSNLGNLLNSFGYSGVSQVGTEGVSNGLFLSVLNKYVDIQIYFFTAVLANNIIVRKFKLTDLICIISILSVIIKSMLNGTRMSMLHVLACFIFALYYFKHKQNIKQKSFDRKYVMYILISMTALLYIFYQIRDYRGTKNNMDILYYISLYTSSPIKSLDLFANAPVESSIFGKETFRTINYNLSLFGNSDLQYERHLEFRWVGNIPLGNVYGASRRYYADFGMIGLILLVLIFAVLINWLYFKHKYTGGRRINFAIIVLSYLYFTVPMFAIDDVFYTELSIGYVFNLLILYALYVLFIKRSLALKIGNIRLN